MIERKGIFCLFGFNRDVRDLVHSQTTFCEFKKQLSGLEREEADDCAVGREDWSV